jgi:hypothetical protein
MFKYYLDELRLQRVKSLCAFVCIAPNVNIIESGFVTNSYVRGSEPGDTFILFYRLAGRKVIYEDKIDNGNSLKMLAGLLLPTVSRINHSFILKICRY